MKKFVKKTIKISVFTLLVIILLIVSGIVAGNIFKDEIKNFVLSEINREIDVKINVGSAEFSVLRKFPFVSVVLNNALALSGKEFTRVQFSGFSTDTLFSASRIYLQFNLLDILHKNYRLRRVHAVDGKLNILIDKYGRVNYRIFKEDLADNQNNFSLGLDGVKITGISWQYLNLAKKIHSKGQIKDLSLKGKFSQNYFSMNSLSTIFIDTFNMEGIEYASKLKIVTRLNLNVNDSIYKINKGELTVNGLKFIAGGSFTMGLKTILDLNISGLNLDINSLISILPVKAGLISKYDLSGNAKLLAKIKGEVSSLATPSIHVAFVVSNGKLFLPVQETYINDISFKGTYSNGSNHNAATSRITLNEYSVNYGENHLSGKLTLNNFINPFLSATLTGSIVARDFSEFIDIDGLELDHGFIFPDLNVNINPGSFNTFKIQNIAANDLNGKLIFKGISGKIPFFGIPLELLEGSVKINGESWYPELNIELGKNKFSTNLIVDHLWGKLVNNSKIVEVNGMITSEYFSVLDLKTMTETDAETIIHFPDSIYLDLNCKVDSFKYGKFLASDLETRFNYKPGLLSVSLLKMQTMKGKINAAGAIIIDNQEDMLLRSSGDIRNIDIHKLFYAFNNFGQNFIVAENLKGIVTGKIDFSGTITPKGTLLTKNLTAQSDFVIEEGELINFEPVTELSSFVELSELKDIKFSTLKNSILIKDEKVYIPQMDIKSSAFNLSASGTHGFDNYFEYKVRLNLSEILAGKARKVKKENEEFGVIEEGESGNSNIYLSIMGTPDSFKIRYDKKEAINKIKYDLKEEKKLLKTILKEELGMFKKDSAIIDSKNNNFEQKQFIMDWGDEKNIPEVPLKSTKDKKNKKKDPAIKVTWEEEDPDLK